jgi:hypothetical protein
MEPNFDLAITGGLWRVVWEGEAGRLGLRMVFSIIRLG